MLTIYITFNQWQKQMMLKLTMTSSLSHFFTTLVTRPYYLKKKSNNKCKSGIKKYTYIS